MIEKALKTIGDWISKETESRKYPKGELLELSESLQALKAEIERQSVKSEDVAEAIKVIQEKIYTHKEFIRQAKNTSMAINMLPDYDKIKHLDLAITALQAYQPWIPVSERLPMEEPDGRHSASKMVLVYAYNGYSDRFASTDITVDGKWYDYSEPEFEVTHWMPLPEPPKGE